MHRTRGKNVWRRYSRGSDDSEKSRMIILLIKKFFVDFQSFVPTYRSHYLGVQ